MPHSPYGHKFEGHTLILDTCNLVTKNVNSQPEFFASVKRRHACPK
jgi:hypothetical protein